MAFSGGAGCCRDSHRPPDWAWLVGYPDRTGVGVGASRGRPPRRPAMAAGVARATGGSSAIRIPARYSSRTPGPFGPGGSQCRSGWALAWCQKVLGPPGGPAPSRSADTREVVERTAGLVPDRLASGDSGR